MSKNLDAPNSGNGSAGNTAEPSGTETVTDSQCDKTTAVYVPASAGSGALTGAGVSSTQPDSLDEGN
jgi:hypothetical protein